MTEPILLAYGDDGFGLDAALREFATSVDAVDRVEIVPDRTPDEASIDRARLEAGTASMFGAHLTVLRQPLRAAGRSNSAIDRLLAVINELPPDRRWRSSRSARRATRASHRRCSHGWPRR